jgi:Ca2+-binding EF-hand superfamily protein
MKLRSFLMVAGLAGSVGTIAVLASAVAEAAKPPVGGEAPNRAMMLLQRFDTNADGIISAEEIKAAQADRLKAMDANGDGKVSADELIAWQQQRRAEFMLKRMDRNHDGVVDAADFQIAGSREATMLLARFDTNGDGQLSGDELAAVNREPMRHMGGFGGPGMMHHGPAGMMAAPGPMIDPAAPDAAPEGDDAGSAP